MKLQLKLFDCIISYIFLQCSLCDNSFCQQANLERHIRKHQESYSNPGLMEQPTSEEEEVDLETV